MFTLLSVLFWVVIGKWNKGQLFYPKNKFIRSTTQQIFMENFPKMYFADWPQFEISKWVFTSVISNADITITVQVRHGKNKFLKKCCQVCSEYSKPIVLSKIKLAYIK